MSSEESNVGGMGANPFAEVLAGMPEVWQRLLDEHVSDRDGRCAACRNSSTVGVPWPCTLRVAAADARAIYAGSRAEGSRELSEPDPCDLAS